MDVQDKLLSPIGSAGTKLIMLREKFPLIENGIQQIRLLTVTCMRYALFMNAVLISRGIWATHTSSLNPVFKTVPQLTQSGEREVHKTGKK